MLATPLNRVTYFNRSSRGEECFAKQLRIRRSLSRYMHHSLIQRQYSQKFTTSQETEKLSLLSIYKTEPHLNNWRSRCYAVHSLSDKTYHINNKITFLRFLQVMQQDVLVKWKNTFPLPIKTFIVAFCKLRISNPSQWLCFGLVLFAMHSAIYTN